MNEAAVVTGSSSGIGYETSVLIDIDSSINLLVIVSKYCGSGLITLVLFWNPPGLGLVICESNLTFTLSWICLEHILYNIFFLTNETEL
jgi:hypothetical protein